MKFPHELALNVGDLKPLEMTVRLRLTAGLRIRLWLAIRLLRLAGWVSGISTNVVIDTGFYGDRETFWRCGCGAFNPDVRMMCSNCGGDR